MGVCGGVALWCLTCPMGARTCARVLMPCVRFLKVFHCVHFECPAQLDTEVTEGSPGLDPSDSGGAAPQQQRSQRASRSHSLLSGQPSSSFSSAPLH